MAKEKQTTAVAVHDESLEALAALFPVEPSFDRVQLPRLGMFSQDKTEGTGKAKKVVTEAGTFYIERQTDEVDEETGRKLWAKDELGTEIEGIILFQRKQLRSYDESSGTFTSSPIYDNDDEIVPLFANRAEVARGTPAELMSRDEFATTDNQTGKEKSSLEENKILYIEYEGEIYQMGLRGSSMFSFKGWRRKLGTVPPSAIVTKFSSTPEKKGSIEWNKMSFEQVRPLTKKELADTLEKVREITDGIAQEKAFFASRSPAKTEEDERGPARRALTSSKKF